MVNPIRARATACQARVLVVSEQPVYRAGLTAVIRKAGIDEAIDVGPDPAELSAALEELDPNAAVIVASDLPQLATRIEVIRARHPRLPIIVVVDGDMGRVDLSDAMRLGIGAFLDAHAAPREFRAAMAALEAGGLFLSSAVASRLAGPGQKESDPVPAVDSLSPRQREVLVLVASGMTSNEIATRLHVSPRTVDSHRMAISNRLGIHNVADLTRYALREGLLGT